MVSASAGQDAASNSQEKLDDLLERPVGSVVVATRELPETDGDTAKGDSWMLARHWTA